jgi:hypothetical protein
MRKGVMGGVGVRMAARMMRPAVLAVEVAKTILDRAVVLDLLVYQTIGFRSLRGAIELVEVLAAATNARHFRKVTGLLIGVPGGPAGFHWGSTLAWSFRHLGK